MQKFDVEVFFKYVLVQKKKTPSLSPEKLRSLGLEGSRFLAWKMTIPMGILFHLWWSDLLIQKTNRINNIPETNQNEPENRPFAPRGNESSSNQLSRASC